MGWFKALQNVHQYLLFLKLMKNTVGISLYSLAAKFPTPILLALALNEVGNRRYRRIVRLSHMLRILFHRSSW